MKQHQDWRKLSYSLLFISLEILIFSNYKYQLLNYFPVPVRNWVMANLTYLKIDLIVVLLALTFISWVYIIKKIKIHNPEMGFFITLIKGVQGKIGSFSSVINTIFIVMNISWIGNVLYGASVTLNNIIIAIIYFLFLLLFSFSTIALFFNKKTAANADEKNRKKVLINALPILREDVLLRVIERNNSFSREQMEDMTTDLWENIDPLRKMLIYFPNVKDVFMFCSDKVVAAESTIILCKDVITKFSITTERAINIYINSYKIQSSGFDANNIEDVSHNIDLQLKDIIKNRGFKNEDIVFNLTSATSIISSVFTLKALREGRSAYHINQTDKTLMPVDLNVLTIQELWDELCDKF